MTIVLNPDKEKANQVLRAVRDNDGYCPCKLVKNEDTKCMCLDFRNQKEGLCHCGLFYKSED